MLDHAQETIGITKLITGLRFDVRLLHQCIQNKQNSLVLQRRRHTSPDQLKNLSEEFDFPNTAGSQFYIVGQALTFDFNRYLTLHISQRIKSAIIKVAAIDKRQEPLT